MRAIEIAEPGGPDVLRLVERPVPQTGSGGRADSRRGGRREPARCVAASRPLHARRPGASDSARPRSGRHGRGGRRRGDRAGAAAMPCARSWPAAAMRSTASRRRCSACRSRRASTSSRPRRFPKRSSRCGPTSSIAARCSRAKSMLVHGGSSGIGTTAIQLGHARGARVVRHRGQRREVSRPVEALGAERAINYRTDDFVARLREITDGRGVDLVLDMVGGDYTARNLTVLAVDGRLVQIAFLQGAAVTLDLHLVMQRRLTITGSTLRPRSAGGEGRDCRGARAHVWPLVESGAVAPRVHATFPLARGRRGASPDGIGRAHRQDRAARLRGWRVHCADELRRIMTTRPATVVRLRAVSHRRGRARPHARRPRSCR